jgi:hypothetical protein
MKYYRKPDGTVLCFKLDGSQDHLIEAGYVLLSDTDVAAYLTEIAAANAITSVTMRQARLALLQTGLLANVTSAISAMPGIEGDTARIIWEFSNTVERDNPLITQIGAALNLTSAQLDDLFNLASTL